MPQIPPARLQQLAASVPASLGQIRPDQLSLPTTSLAERQIGPTATGALRAGGPAGAIAGAAALAGASSKPGGVPRIPRANISEEVLPNGARIIVNDRPGAGTMSVQIGTAAGALQDPAGKEGAAHLIEHMSFEGTGLRPHSSIFRSMQEMGGQGNAGTQGTDIVFSTTVPNQEGTRAVKLFSDLYRNPNSGRYNLAREKRIVEQEMRYRYGEKPVQAGFETMRLLLGKRADRYDAIGNVDTVNKVTPGDIRNYTGKWFTGTNTVAMLDGDAKRMPIDELRRQLSKLPAGTERATDPKFEGFETGAKAELIPHNGDAQANVSVILPNPLHTTDMIAALGDSAPSLGIVGSILGNVLSAKVNERLRERAKLTYGASAAHGTEGGEFMAIDTELDPRNLREGMAQITRAVRTLPQSITDADVNRAKRELINKVAMQSADPSAAASGLFGARLEGDTGKQGDVRAMLRTIDKQLTPAMVRDAAKLYAASFRDMKVLATGAVQGRFDDIAGGIADGGVQVDLQRQSYARSRYDKMLDTPQGPVQQ